MMRRIISPNHDQMNAQRGNRPARIVLVNRYFSPDQSATSQLLSDLSFGLAQRGRDIHVICSRQRYDEAAARLAKSETMNLVTVHRVWTTSFGRDRLIGRALDYATFYLSSLFAMLALLGRGDTVVAKTDPPLLSIVAMIAARIKRAALVNWLQDLFPEVASELGANPLPRWLDALLRRLRDASLRAARVNVVLGSRMCELLESRGIPRSKLRVIENWADLIAEPVPPAASVLRSSLELGGKFVVAYSGNLGRAHEFDTLLGAATLLMSQRDIVFLMIGGGAGMPLLKRAVLQQGLDNFRFLNYQPRSALADSLGAADVHLVSLRPSLEGLIVPSKFYGILAAARPVIFVGDPDGELARIILPADIGGVVRAGDAAELARQIAALKADPRRGQAMGDNGARLYAQRYGLERALTSWSEIIDAREPASALTQAVRGGDALTRAPSGR